MSQKKSTGRKADLKAVPNASRVIDLDQARIARAEARGEQDAPQIRLGGEDWKLPEELPYLFAEEVYSGRFREGIRILLGEEKADEFLGGLSTDDFEQLSDGIFEVYGLDRGK